jgi:hypothetical protein
LYLDVNWEVCISLAEEAEILFTKCPLAFVMVGAFEALIQAGYSYEYRGENTVVDHLIFGKER